MDQFTTQKQQQEASSEITTGLGSMDSQEILELPKFMKRNSMGFVRDCEEHMI